MNIDQLTDILKRQDGLSNTLGMKFISTPEDNTLQAEMRVNDANKQVFGFLSGGATLALAENVAGVGSMALCPGKICVGIHVDGHHVRSVLSGDSVTAHALLKHKGRTLHVWSVDIQNSKGELISTVNVTNYILTPARHEAKMNQGKPIHE